MARNPNRTVYIGLGLGLAPVRDGALAPVVRQFVQTLQAAARTTRTISSMANAVLPGDSPVEPVGNDGEKGEEALHGWPHHRAAQRPVRLSWRRSWWRRQAMAVIVVDVVLRLVLFGVWMFVCHGLEVRSAMNGTAFTVVITCMVCLPSVLSMKALPSSKLS